MLRSNLMQKALCFVIGFALPVFTVGLIARTMAFAAPAGFFAWFKANGALELGLFLWDLVVGHGLGMGVPAFVVLLVAFRFFAAPTAGAVVAFLAGALLALHGLMPLLYGYRFGLLFDRHWFNYALEAALLIAALSALFVARWLWRRPPMAAQVPTTA